MWWFLQHWDQKTRMGILIFNDYGNVVHMCVVEEETVNNPFDIGLSQRGFMPHNSPQVVPNVQRTKGQQKQPESAPCRRRSSHC